MDLFIKNMVCDRCKMVVQTQLSELGLHPISVDLGHVVLSEKELNRHQTEQLKGGLMQQGFELLSNRKQQTVEKTKAEIVKLIYYNQEGLRTNLSDYLSDKLNLSYSTLSASFSNIEGISIEKYFIEQKIERVKELISYNELSLSEIADQLNYSSIAHLSSQFKKVTGLTPSEFKLGNSEGRITIDRV